MTKSLDLYEELLSIHARVQTELEVMQRYMVATPAAAAVAAEMVSKRRHI